MAQGSNVIKVAHRGAMGYEPENTLLAFQKAIEIGADMIELDVHPCKSGELVVIHDDTVDRTTNGRGRVEDMTLEELKGLVEAKGERIPALEEALDFTDKKIKLNIELKAKNSAQAISEIIERYVEEKKWNYGDFMVSSFHHGELEQLSKINPKIEIGVLTEMVPPGFLNFAEKMGASSVNVPVDRIDEEFVENAHELGLKVFVYAANDTDEIEKAKNLNADYICSNFPDKI